MTSLTTRNPANQATTSVPKRLKLQFRNRIALPVFTGKRLLGENESTIEIALVDAITEQIMNTGAESTAKLEIIGFRVGDDGSVDDRFTLEDFQQTILSGKKGKRILQGDTCLQLKEGVCFVSKISFTHNSENTKNGWYRLGAGVVDASLMNRVEVARTEAFLMKDGRTAYYEKHPYPRLSDKILQIKASSNIWGDIVKNAHASNGMFLCFDPGNEGKTGVVLSAKRQLKGLIIEPHTYVPVNQLSAKQKVDSKELVKFASQHFETLRSFEDETSLKEYLMSSSCTSFSSNGLTETQNNFNESNLGQHTTEARILTSPYERGKETVPFDNEMTYSMDFHPEYVPVLESPNGTEAGTSSQVVESTLNTCGHMDTNNVFDQCLDCLIDNPDSIIYFDKEWHFEPVNSQVMMMAAQTVSVCSIARARTRWTRVSKLLRRNSVRERIGLTEGIQALKKQRWCY
ncbi:hypothetical protein L2E82_15837 [Cichorium intybus]|uniref:Uncharacterized protein n=1 Tax=Cichorium intybus TaxID=13427 RepID=A0ACB9F4H0_CICIN|nr:hypothetical protein L2E82_15837 [Cichorium intybus]